MRRDRFILWSVAAIVTTAPAARAQSAQDKADAEVLFNAAKAALAAGNFAEACPKFAESQRKDPAIGTSLYLAECYEKSGKIASAWAEFRQAEDMAKQRGDGRASLARGRADRLQPSTVTVVLGPGADSIAGLEIKRDGAVLVPAQLRLASPVDGGQHVVTASASGFKPFEWRGDVPQQKGAITVTIPKLEPAPQAVASSAPTSPSVVSTPATSVTAPSPPAAPGAEQRGGANGLAIAGLVVAGAGVVAIGVGSGLGLAAKGNYDTSNATYGCVAGSASCTTQDGVDLRNSAITMAGVSTALFIGGGVFIAGGLAMFFLAPKRKPVATAVHLVPLVSSGGGGAMLLGRF